MNLFQLRYFVKLAHVRHYTKAAEELCITQPSLSHAMAELEKELGVPLFEKSGRNTDLTRFGEEFLSCAEHTLSVLDEGVTSIRRSARGEGLIRLGLLRTLGTEFIPRLAKRFLTEHAGRDIRFSFCTGATQTLLDALSARRCDLVFCSQPPADGRFEAVPVGRQDIVLIVPQEHPLAARHGVDLSETLAYPHIFFSKDSGMRSVVESLFARLGKRPVVAYETEEDEVIAGLVAQGFGIAVVPYMDLLLKLDVKILQIGAPAYERQFFMVSDAKTYMPPVVRLFRQFVLDSEGGE